ncbi:MAG TPA: TolC family protein [Vicinamibacterales bacterium]|nr:TolC family protein [Vicinamibacterales bacterium]
MFRITVARTVAALAAPVSAQVQVPSQGSFLGGVPAGTATDQTLPLSLTGAIERALEHNLGVLTSSDRVDVARGTRWRALSELLPNVSAQVGETRQQINLQSFGLTLPGLPTIVGPFNVFDARVYVTQSVLDFKTINDARAESHRLAAERLSYKSARDLVVLATANGYLQVLAAHARADSANAQRETAQALFNQAVDLRQGGLTAGIDVVRAEVQLATERQRATAATNDLEKAKLQLARAIGLPVGQAFSTTDDLPYRPAPDVTIEQALDRAARTRPDYQAALEQVRAAEASRRAALGEALPSLHVNADYGTIGLTAPESRGTFSVAALASIPIFQGGRAQGRLIETDAELRTRRAEAADLKAGVYYDVRTAFLDLQATGEQLQVATRARELAASQLSQARDRFAAGVADNIEVVQAQEAVALASEQYIAALYGFNFSKASLARAMGVAETAIRDYLGGDLE